MGLRGRIKDVLAPHPRLFLPLFRQFGAPGTGDYLVENDTEVVIEGFPRSANTFAVVGFRMMQGRPVRIAHHVHVEAQVIEGVRRGRPVLVVTRRPTEVIRSLKLVLPDTDENRALRRWLAFHEAVTRVADRVVISDLPDTTTRLGAVIQRLNHRFGTGFRVCPEGKAFTDAVFGEIAADQALLGTQTFAGVPSHARTLTRRGVALSLDRGLLAEAEALHRELASMPPAVAPTDLSAAA